MQFLDAASLLDSGPLQFPRRIERLLWHLGFSDVSNIDGSGDEGATFSPSTRARPG